jgi:crotonobetaine/carnitine-CoA ligase
MISAQGKTIGKAFQEAVAQYPNNIFLMAPKDLDRVYHPNGYSITYLGAQKEVDKIASQLSIAGYGHGHRIAVLLENQVEFVFIKLACNQLGISIVPVNPDYRSAEIAYLLEDSCVELAIVLQRRSQQFMDGVSESTRKIPVVLFENIQKNIPLSLTRAPDATAVHTETEASLLYTSGTTGKPKGCRTGHEYELMVGFWYLTRGGVIQFEEGKERLLNPLPLFHINAAILSLFAVMLTGNCQIQQDRFSPSKWWPMIRETEATIVHYLGTIVPILMKAAPTEHDQDHKVKFAFGAGLEPVLHEAFERRFGFPLIEGWGMTEFCRLFLDCHEPRQINTRAIGKPQPGLEVRVVDLHDNDVPVGESGEMLLRHSAQTPRKWAFLGYLNQPEITEDAWKGGWLHTGDSVFQDETGMIYFVDRKKNIIRRSGENIAAAEVEAIIQGHSAVAQVTCIAVTDELRDEEVFACIVPATQTQISEATALDIFNHCFARLAYYKAPGWLLFVESLPVTATQKVLKHKIFSADVDPRKQEGVYDLRRLKKRTTRAQSLKSTPNTKNSK